METGGKEKEKARKERDTGGTTGKKYDAKTLPSARLGNAIKVSTRDGQSYIDIMREMKAMVDPWKAGRSPVYPEDQKAGSPYGPHKGG